MEIKGFSCKELHLEFTLQHLLSGEGYKDLVVFTVKDFKNYLKHKGNKMGLEDLIVKLIIEENARRHANKIVVSRVEASAHLVDSN